MEDQQQLFKQFGSKMPTALEKERQAVADRLNDAPPVWTAG
jgi:hypothetical protein